MYISHVFPSFIYGEFYDITVATVDSWSLPPTTSIWYFCFKGEESWSTALSQCSGIWAGYINVCVAHSSVLLAFKLSFVQGY